MALNAGFKITERRNHGYRVRYYEPAGTDATIYDPAQIFVLKTIPLITFSLRPPFVMETTWSLPPGNKRRSGGETRKL